MNWQNVNFGILTVFRTIINYCWKGGMACCETDTTKNSRWYYVWMIDDRWLVSLTTSRQSHLQTCLFADDCIMYGPWLCRPTARPWCFSRVGTQVGWWISSSEMQCPECIKIQTPSHKLIGHIMNTEDATKYLGVNLKATVSWKTHIEIISNKPNSMPRILRRSRRSCGED